MSDSPRQAVNLNWMKTEPHRGSGESAEDFARRLQRDESPVDVSDLAAFLTARLAEDEAAVDRSRGGSLRGQWPARVLREAEAKRKILAEHWAEHITEGWVACRRCVDWSARSYGYGNEDEEGEPPDDQSRMNWPCPTLRTLAAVYSDHEDYREEWRP